MAIKKSELYSSLWKSCDELRGGMDASQYKDYALVLLFVKYVSDKYAGQPDALLDVPKGGSFADMVALKGKPNIGEGMNTIIATLAEANDLKGVIDVADFDDPDRLGSGKDMQDRLSNLVAIFENPALDFRQNRAEGDDLLGDAYEYLMRHFATESGKSKGQFYTPAEVSRVMAKVIGINQAKSQDQTIYDPTCGSGSLLLKAADEATTGVTIYGQEMDNATAALAKMNMILHDNPTAEIWKDNSLSRPHWTDKTGKLKTFDFVVANPPFSSKAWSNGFDAKHDVYERFADGIPPKRNGDYAFLLHIIRSLNSSGKGAVIMPHGVLFRGNTEAGIRQNLVRKGYIKGVIGLPPNLFYGTGIPACIIVLDKENAESRRGIFMIDASKGFMKDGNKNRLRHQDIHKIVDVFTRQATVPKYARMVSLAEIEANDYNLNLPRYIDSAAPEDLQDIDAHLLGGIPNLDVDALDDYWKEFPTLKAQLFTSGPRPGYSQLAVETEQVKPTIFAHPEFVTCTQSVTALFEAWRTRNEPGVKGLGVGSHPKALIETLSEDILRVFAGAPLIDKYDIYQHLMTYWVETMQDDVYLVAQDGWCGANRLRLIVEDKDQKNKEKPDFVVGKLKYKADLIPPALIVARYFAAEQAAIEQMEADLQALLLALEELRSEQSDEDGLLEGAIDEKDNITKASIKTRLRDIFAEPDAADERAVLAKYLDLLDQQSALSTRIREAQRALDARVAAKYPTLSEDEVKVLVVDDKWLATLAADVQHEVERISQALTERIKELADRYAITLPQLSTGVEQLSATVDAHLKVMGYTW